MPDIADLYEQLRNDISELVAGLEPDQLETPVPATPGWTVRDIVAHLAADATYVLAGDFPNEFFQAFGDEQAVATLNGWTTRQLEERRGRSLEELLQEWKTSGTEVAAMMRGDKPWPDDAIVFGDRVLLTDAAVHQQDLFGALGIEAGRDNPAISIGLKGYITVMGWRLGSAGIPPLLLDVGGKTYAAGEGEAGATVRASRFEFFRAMSGRRSPAQIRAYDWEGDPEPYISYFYPYGVRQEALTE